MNIRYRGFDLETDGLLEEVTRVHVMVVTDYTTGQRFVFRRNDTEDSIGEGIKLLTEEGVIVVAHNGTGYDCEVLRKLYGVVIPWQNQRDTMVLSRLIWPDLARIDAERRKKAAGKSFPGNLVGSHSLEAWGHRLGEHKGDYRGDPSIPDEKERYSRRWERWNQSMEDYCVQDMVVTDKLWALIQSKEYSEQAILIETQVAYILARQERYGFLFDEKKAAQLYAVLVQRRLELETEVKAVFKPLFLRDGKDFTPARDNARMGYVRGAPFTKVKLTEFNPGSRDHVSYWLKLHYGWEPTEFTADGKPKVDDEVISKLPYAEAKPLKDYYVVQKRIGQLAEGNKAWMKLVRKDGRIHGRVNTNGAVTGRMTHMDPNTAQVPSNRAPYGKECRELFCVPPGKKEVHCDADALELRCLAGYMAAYDGGAYIKTVLEGKKELGTDMHTVNCRALGMDPKALQWNGESGRDVAKTWFYAFIYGAGDEKLGLILTGRRGPQARKRGKSARDAFLRNLPAMGKLVTAVKQVAKERGFLRGLDGRQLSVRSQHAALNTLLQSAGAVLMKKALCIHDDALQERGLVPGGHYEYIVNVHDELGLEVDISLAEEVGQEARLSIQRAGQFFNFRCPLDGQYEVGDNWAECH